jgi:phospholipid/cholesterol/gamma-HCH transport system permease protein
MSDVTADPAEPGDQPADQPNLIVRGVEAIGQTVIDTAHTAVETVRFVGGLTLLVGSTASWVFRTLIKREAKFGKDHLFAQMVRVGIRSIPIVTIVQVFIGIILALQMAPTLRSYGQIQRIADIVGIAVFRELGPLLSGIVLSGFAGASIAAELGTMVEGEEIKALRSIALNPIRFLVMPRALATVVMLTVITVIADVVGVFGGFLTSTFVLNISAGAYISETKYALVPKDFISGVIKAPVFGLLIAMIACYEGLHVTGGAEGVGRATTNTVVKCIVALITADVVATALLYAFGI